MNTSTLSKGRVFAHIVGNLVNTVVAGGLVLGMMSLSDRLTQTPPAPERVVSETKTDRLPEAYHFPDPGTLSFIEEDTAPTTDEVELAKGIYFEARGESFEGQADVAKVILKRVTDSRWPNSVHAVLSQDEKRRNRCQFSYMCDGKPERITNQVAWQEALFVAKRVYQAWKSGADMGCAHSYHADYASAKATGYFSSLRKEQKVGRHIFYCDKKS